MVTDMVNSCNRTNRIVADETIADLLEAMPMDDATEILSSLEDERAKICWT